MRSLRHLRPCVRCVTFVPSQIEAQRSGFDLERRCDGMTESCRLRRDEGYEVRADEGKQSLRPTLSVAGSR